MKREIRHCKDTANAGKDTFNRKNYIPQAETV